MRKAENLVEIDYVDKKLIYNPFLNKACIVDKTWYEEVLGNINGDICESLSNRITIEETELLERNGVIVTNEQNYQSRSYSLKLKQRNAQVEIGKVYFHVTQRCNLRCTYCYNKKNLEKPDALGTEDMLLIGNKLKQIGVKSIVLTGGEPLIRDDIQEIAEEFFRIGFRLSLLTNGTYILNKKEILNFVDSAIISIDTLNSMNDIRKGLNISRLIEALQAIPMDQRNKISLRSVITKENTEDWQAVKEFAQANGYKFISAIFIPNNKREICHQPPVEKIELSMDSLNFSGNICGGCYKEIAIDSNGDIYPCQTLVSPEHYITNITKDTWHDELKGARITSEFMERTVDTIERCKTCPYRYLCGGGCRAIAYNLYGSLDSYSECMCKYQMEVAKSKLLALLTRCNDEHK